jgi:hypothetical protein
VKTRPTLTPSKTKRIPLNTHVNPRSSKGSRFARNVTLFVPRFWNNINAVHFTLGGVTVGHAFTPMPSPRRRATLQNNRDLWAALDLIREAIEWQGVGLLPNGEMVTPDP